MESKDTVKPVLPHSESIWCPHCGEEFGIESRVEDERGMQAEISFKAGVDFAEAAIKNQLLEVIEASKKVGIREVVEWMEKNRYSTSWNNVTFRVPIEGWQDKLKEWGID